jgi:hypothetical protein
MGHLPHFSTGWIGASISKRCESAGTCSGLAFRLQVALPHMGLWRPGWGHPSAFRLQARGPRWRLTAQRSKPGNAYISIFLLNGGLKLLLDAL